MVTPLQPGAALQNDPGSEAVAQMLQSVLTNQIVVLQAEAEEARLSSEPTATPVSPAQDEGIPRPRLAVIAA